MVNKNFDHGVDSLSLERQILLAQVAERYYVKEQSQQEISDALDTSRSNVSRLLDAARKHGVIKFVVANPIRRHTELENKLRARAALDDICVVASADESLELVGNCGARWIEQRKGGRLAIGWGRCVQAAIDQVSVEQPINIEIVQIGGDLTIAPAASGHELVRRLANALGGRYEFLHSPAIVETERAATELLSDPRIASQLDRARTSDAALIGIGTPDLAVARHASPDIKIDESTVASDVAARLLDHSGNELDSPLRQRVVALEIEDLRAIPEVVGIAAGGLKGAAIAAVLRAGLINVLICDQPAAARALEELSRT